jgi:2-polyprenyl-3-methyl-5-hydroxy-6-metoxy-1,4-benzoquinol methylase
MPRGSPAGRLSKATFTSASSPVGSLRPRGVHAGQHSRFRVGTVILASVLHGFFIAGSRRPDDPTSLASTMPTRGDYHEAVWEGVPEGLTPLDFALRSRFLLNHVRAGERLLDVGCGEGRFAAELARAGIEVVGIDVAAEPLRRAHLRRPELDLRQVQDGEAWPLEDASFDAVWAGEVIEHVTDTAGWLSEVRRVLRSGGSLLLSTPDHGRLQMLWWALAPRAFEAHFNPCADHLRFYTRRALIEVLEDFGFHDVEARSSGWLPDRRLLASARRARF